MTIPNIAKTSKFKNILQLPRGIFLMSYRFRRWSSYSSLWEPQNEHYYTRFLRRLDRTQQIFKRRLCFSSPSQKVLTCFKNIQDAFCLLYTTIILVLGTQSWFKINQPLAMKQSLSLKLRRRILTTSSVIITVRWCQPPGPSK